MTAPPLGGDSRAVGLPPCPAPGHEPAGRPVRRGTARRFATVAGHAAVAGPYPRDPAANAFASAVAAPAFSSGRGTPAPAFLCRFPAVPRAGAHALASRPLRKEAGIFHRDCDGRTRRAAVL